jgi:hypothetical protein
LAFSSAPKVLSLMRYSFVNNFYIIYRFMLEVKTYLDVWLTYYRLLQTHFRERMILPYTILV